MNLPDHLTHDREEIESIISQERDIENHIEEVSGRLDKLEEMEQEAERYKQEGENKKASRLEQEIVELNRQILNKDFKNIIRQIRKGEEETGEILSHMPVEKIDVGKMKKLTKIAELIEEHFEPKQKLGNPESDLYSSGQPEIAQNPDEQRGRNDYPNQKISDKYETMSGAPLQEEEVIILNKLSSGTYWYNYSGSIYEMAVLGDEIIQDLKLAKSEIQELNNEINEDEDIIKRAEETSEEEDLEVEETSEEKDLKKAEETVREMNSRLEELINHHQEEKSNLEEYKKHLGEFEEAAQTSLNFVENVVSYVEEFKESNRRDPDLEKHIAKIMGQSPNRLANELREAIEYSEKAKKEN